MVDKTVVAAKPIVKGINKNLYSRCGIISVAGVHGSVAVSNEEVAPDPAPAADGSPRPNKLKMAIENGIGIYRRFRNAPDENVWIEATAAIELACMRIAFDINELDGIWCGGFNGTDLVMPGPTSPIADLLGLDGYVSGGLAGTGCAGFLQALQAACTQLDMDTKSGNARVYAVVGADQLWNLFPESGTGMDCAIFGEGASCVLVTNDFFLLDTHQHLLVTMSSSVTTPKGSYNAHCRTGGILHHKASWIKQFTSDIYERLLASIEKDTLAPGTLLIPHQANCVILKDLEAGLDRVTVHTHTIETYGNLSAASIPMAIAHEWENDGLANGRPVASMAFGEGMTFIAFEFEPKMDCLARPVELLDADRALALANAKARYWASDWGKTDPRRPSTF